MSKLFAVVAVALAVALSFTCPAKAEKGGGGGQAGQLKVEGTVTAVEPSVGTLTITTKGGVEVKLSVTATTKIERNDRKSALASFKIGDRGQAIYAPGGAASKVEATGP
jgi:type 1 fimbria pilin